jgi:transcriptional regulator with XRE-family HTH domain
MDYKDKFKKLTEKLENKPEYKYEGLLFEFVEQVLEIMEREQLSRTDLAKKLGCSNAYITKLFKGNQNLTLRKIFEIADALGCSFNFAIKPVQKPSLQDEWISIQSSLSAKEFSSVIITPLKKQTHYENSTYIN